jgi:enoyl-CoA hydratase
MTTEKPHLLLKRDDAIATISINDAPWNRMSLEFIDELEKVIDELAVDKSVRAIIITGEGDENFSVGMNLKQMMGKAGDKGMIMAVLDQRLRVLSTIENLKKPVIATLFGYCLGGGLELPLACHFRLAAEKDAKIGLPEMDLGTVPAWGGSARLVRCVGRMHALDMILRARKISGPEAYRIGLVNEVVPNDRLKARAREIALELASMPPLAVSEMLRCVVRYGDRPLQERLFEERRAVLRTMGPKEMKKIYL